MSMTPERIEEIKQRATEAMMYSRSNGGWGIQDDMINDIFVLLAALAEAQRQNRIKSEEIEIRKGNIKVVTDELATAQQTIARQTKTMREALNVLGEMKMFDARLWGVYCDIQEAVGGFLARVALGNKEGEKTE